MRLAAAGRVLAYTGDSGGAEIITLARGADLLLAEATYPDQVPPDEQPLLCSARQAGQYAAQAGASRLLLTHLWPGTDQGTARAAAAAGYDGDIGVARPGLAAEV